jgi:hypothetical protein
MSPILTRSPRVRRTISTYASWANHFQSPWVFGPSPRPAPPTTNSSPSLSVSSTGLVGVSWLDRRNDPADVKYQAFAAISTDRGQTFPITQLTKAFSNPDQSGDPNWMGDYTGNTWVGGDSFAAWMDSSNDVDIG